MGIKSTYYIDRQTALDVIEEKIHKCSNDQLAEMLLAFDESYFRNYSVTDVLPDDSERKIVCVSDF